jgi:hypothetical protein
MGRTSGMLAWTILLFAGTAYAGTVSPTKASQLVDLQGDFSNACDGLGGGITAPSRQNADGSSVAFTVPNKQVLVVVSAEVLLFGATPATRSKSGSLRGRGSSPSSRCRRRRRTRRGGLR